MCRWVDISLVRHPQSQLLVVIISKQPVITNTRPRVPRHIRRGPGRDPRLGKLKQNILHYQLVLPLAAARPHCNCQALLPQLDIRWSPGTRNLNPYSNPSHLIYSRLFNKMKLIFWGLEYSNFSKRSSLEFHSSKSLDQSFGSLTPTLQSSVQCPLDPILGRVAK